MSSTVKNQAIGWHSKNVVIGMRPKQYESSYGEC